MHRSPIRTPRSSTNSRSTHPPLRPTSRGSTTNYRSRNPSPSNRAASNSFPTTDTHQISQATNRHATQRTLRHRHYVMSDQPTVAPELISPSARIKPGADLHVVRRTKSVGQHRVGSGAGSESDECRLFRRPLARNHMRCNMSRLTTPRCLCHFRRRAGIASAKAPSHLRVISSAGTPSRANAAGRCAEHGRCRHFFQPGGRPQHRADLGPKTGSRFDSIAAGGPRL